MVRSPKSSRRSIRPIQPSYASIARKDDIRQPRTKAGKTEVVAKPKPRVEAKLLASFKWVLDNSPAKIIPATYPFPTKAILLPKEALDAIIQTTQIPKERRSIARRRIQEAVAAACEHFGRHLRPEIPQRTFKRIAQLSHVFANRLDHSIGQDAEVVEIMFHLKLIRNADEYRFRLLNGFMAWYSPIRWSRRKSSA
jgi:hypothetical protein